uniref:Uncharacterized protein n=1 Tax=Grammatophora oceanica TaxID=210454 RepID=A0A7S1UNP6_9STRA
MLEQEQRLPSNHPDGKQQRRVLTTTSEATAALRPPEHVMNAIDQVNSDHPIGGVTRPNGDIYNNFQPHVPSNPQQQGTSNESQSNQEQRITEQQRLVSQEKMNGIEINDVERDLIKFYVPATDASQPPSPQPTTNPPTPVPTSSPTPLPTEEPTKGCDNVYDNPKPKVGPWPECEGWYGEDCKDHIECLLSDEEEDTNVFVVWPSEAEEFIYNRVKVFTNHVGKVSATPKRG